MIFTHRTGNDDNEFVSEREDPVTVTHQQSPLSHGGTS